MADQPPDPDKKPEEDPLGTTIKLVSASHLAYFLPAAVILGALAGRWIGGKFGHTDGGTLLGLLWGIAAGIWEVWKVQKGLNRKP